MKKEKKKQPLNRISQKCTRISLSPPPLCPPPQQLTGWHAPVPNNYFLAALFQEMGWGGLKQGGKYSSGHLSASPRGGGRWVVGMEGSVGGDGGMGWG